MNLFRRPSDSSSEDSEANPASAQRSSNGHSETTLSTGSSRGGIGARNDAFSSSIPNAGSVSISDLQSELSIGPGASVDEHRDILLASLLEDYLRTRAAEFLNTTHPGRNYTRESPEIQPIAEQLFGQTGQVLSSNNLLSTSSVSGGQRDTRRQYLSVLDNLTGGGLTSTINLLNPIRGLVVQSSNLSSLPHPANDLQLTLQQPLRSHYLSNFEELALLGKGAFGKVFECRNALDQTKYAVKKIPLSPKLTKRFREGNHGGMEEILREVKALAMLDHANVVRYHATWIEQPQQMSMRRVNQADTDSTRAITARSGPRRLLLHDRPFDSGTDDESILLTAPEKSASEDGIVFGEDSTSNPGNVDPGEAETRGLQWSEPSNPEQRAVELLSSDGATSDVFTDGKGATGSRDVDHHTDGSNGGTPVLYIQMSLYPMTLSQYLSPSSSTDSTKPRHCYHLLPTLRLLLAILTGLQYIHANHLIHRDIKPGNIFLSDPKMTPDNGYCDVSCYSCTRRAEEVFNRWLNPRIGDFGLVAQIAKEGFVGEATSSVDAHKPVGTAYYRPPVWRGRGIEATESGSDKSLIDEKVDIFALGVVFMEMLWQCGTAMERVDMLKDLQRGFIPSGLRQKLEAERFETPVVEDALALARAMVDPNPLQRWSGEKVKGSIEGLLGRISHGPK